MAKSLSFLDKTFWITESDDNPKHIASLQVLEMPDGVEPQTYIAELVNEVRSHRNAVSPFSCRVSSVLGYPLSLKPVEALNMDYHIKLQSIDDIANSEALDDFVAKMHETRLDPDKPLWQFHILHDGTSRRYAMYVRVHHMYGDGATLVRWFQTGYLEEPRKEDFEPVWAVKRRKYQRTPSPLPLRVLRGVLNVLHVTKDILIIFIRLLLRLTRINRHYMPVPFTGTKTVFTGQVKAGRAVATMDIDFERIKKVGKRCRATANEVLLCAFDIGVHRFLQDHGHTFKKALLTNVPINLRKPGEVSGGNKIAIVPVQLAHGEHDPYLRLRQIINNHRIVKNAAQRANPASFSVYTIIIQSVALLIEWCRASDIFPPIANILISNVPGPNETRYLRDSKLLASYPISTITPGGGVNITLMTYAGVANIGFVCSNKKVQDLHPLVTYVNEAFSMLEQSTEDHTLSIDDIGEEVEEVPVSIIDDEYSSQLNQNLSR